MIFSENFKHALEDYSRLLNKKYPENAIHELISTRYSLSHFERSILYRGITINETAEKRMNRIISTTKLKKQVLHIDLFNVLYTLAAYLRGYPVFISTDSLVRDASESHGSGDWEVHLLKSLELVMEDLDRLKINKAVIYVDNPLEHYQVIFEKLKVLSNRLEPEIKIIADQSPDHLIREAKDGIIATSDSTIIDKSSLQVFDLPKAVLEFHFEPKLLRLSEVAM